MDGRVRTRSGEALPIFYICMYIDCKGMGEALPIFYICMYIDCKGMGEALPIFLHLTSLLKVTL